MKSIMNKKAMALTIALSSVLALSSAGAIAQTRGGGYGRCAGDIELCQNKFTNLTDEQKTFHKQAMVDFQAKTENLRTQLREKQTEYHNLLGTTEPNEAQIKATASEISKLRNQMFDERVALDIQLAKKGISKGMKGSRMGGMHHRMHN